MRKHLRSAFIGLLILVVGGALFSANTKSTESSPQALSAKKVTLIVDFGGSRNPVSRDLTLPASGTGWDVLVASKLGVQGTAQFPKGFVCRIAGWPITQDCLDSPTYAEGHWAYYVSSLSLGGNWVLSGQGAGRHKPDCGGYEGWSWVPGGSEGAPPRFTPTARGCK